MIFISILIMVGIAVGFASAKRGINPYIVAAIVGIVGAIGSYFAVDLTDGNGSIGYLYATPFLIMGAVAALAGYFFAVRSKGEVQ